MSCIVALLWVLPSAAQKREVLAWQTCVTEASANNASLQAARQELRSRELEVGSLRSGYYPEISGEASVDHSDTNKSGDVNSYSAAIVGKQNVFGGFSDQKKIEQARASVGIASAALDIARAQASFDLKTGYQDLLFAQSNKRLTERIIERREENARLVSLRYDSGRENRGSVLLFRAYFEQARYEDLQARHEIEVSSARLRRILGRDGTGVLEVAGEIPLSEPPASPDFEQLAQQTPEYRRAIAEEESARAAASLAASPYYPSLDLNGRVARQGDDASPDENTWSVGATLSVPLFNGFRDYYGVKSAGAQAEAFAVNALEIARKMRTELERTYTGFVEAREKVRIDQAFLEAATARAEIARSKYNNGLLSFEDWDVIENDLIARQKNHLQSLRDLVAAEAAWEQAQGKAVFE